MFLCLIDPGKTMKWSLKIMEFDSWKLLRNLYYKTSKYLPTKLLSFPYWVDSHNEFQLPTSPECITKLFEYLPTLTSTLVVMMYSLLYKHCYDLIDRCFILTGERFPNVFYDGNDDEWWKFRVSYSSPMLNSYFQIHLFTWSTECTSWTSSTNPQWINGSHTVPLETLEPHFL